MTEPFIKFDNVYKSFGDNHVMKGVTFSINKGEVSTIIGKSGVGKSVLLKHIIDLMQNDEGVIYYEGTPFSEMNKADRKKMRRKFSYMFQGTALFDSMNIYENIALPLKETTKIPKKEIRELVREKMDQLELLEHEDRYPSQISGGMKKRVALARALITNPEVVLFDEPTTGLDPIRRNAVHSMISEYQKRFGFTCIIVSHEIPDVFYISQKIAMLDEGRIIFEGTPDEIQKSENPSVRNFIGGVE